MIRPRELHTTLGMFPARTPTLPPATHTNSYALGGREVVLVEPATPFPGEQRAWVEWARGLQSAGREIKAIVATHHHPDHVGGASFLAKELALPLWAHELTADRIQTPVAKFLVEGEEIVLDGPIAESWKVLHTPGHAPGHVCLFEPRSRTVIVGDMVASVGTILVTPGDGDMTAYLAQLERLASLDAFVALPAHGDPIDEPSKLFRHYVTHRLAREKKILTALATFGEKGADAAAIVPIAYEDTPPHVWPIAILSTESHLEKLERDGMIERTSEARGHFRVLRSG
jgi:endoribonuclease LACTB2